MLRNAYGDGHGKTKSFKSLPSRYARLVVGAAITVVYFYGKLTRKEKLISKRLFPMIPFEVKLFG